MNSCRLLIIMAAYPFAIWGLTKLPNHDWIAWIALPVIVLPLAAACMLSDEDEANKKNPWPFIASFIEVAACSFMLR